MTHRTLFEKAVENYFSPESVQTRELMLKYFEEEIKATGIFQNTNFTHALVASDYMINHVKKRLCIITKGFLFLFKGFEKDLKNALSRIEENGGIFEVLITANTKEKQQATKEFYIEAIGVKESNVRLLKEGKTINDTLIIADNSFRIGKNSGKKDGELGINDIKANIVFGNDTISELMYKKFADYFNTYTSRIDN